MAVEVDPFDTAFADLIRDEKKTPSAAGEVKDPPAPAPAPTPAPAPAAEAPAPVAEAPAAPAAEGDEPASEIEALDDTGGEPALPPAPAAADNDALSRLADMLAQRQTQQQPQPAPAPAPPPAAFNADDQAFLTQYMTDFPDVARAESLFRQAEYRALTSHIFAEVNRYFAPRMALLDQLADGAAYSQITQKVPNYDTTRDQVVEWVKTQPAYLQTAYNHVIASGTVDEISDLFDRFSQATGVASPSNAGGVAPAGGQQGKVSLVPAAKPAAELSPAAKQAVARLAPVNGKRTAPTQGAPQTFDAAFEAFAKEA